MAEVLNLLFDIGTVGGLLSTFNIEIEVALLTSKGEATESLHTGITVDAAIVYSITEG